MNDKIKNAFGAVRAEEELIERTKNAVLQHQRRSISLPKLMIPAVCALALILGGIGLNIFFTPVSIISIDVNPSLELGVNSLGRVISVEGFNDDGIRIAQKLNVKFMTFSKAVENILGSSEIKEYTDKNEQVYISVAALSEETNLDNIWENLVKTAGNEAEINVCAGKEYVSEAHNAGLSCGKYHAYLELKELDPDAAVSDVENMTMREIHELIDDCKNDGGQGGHSGKGHHGNGYHGGHD